MVLWWNWNACCRLYKRCIPFVFNNVSVYYDTWRYYEIFNINKNFIFHCFDNKLLIFLTLRQRWYNIQPTKLTNVGPTLVQRHISTFAKFHPMLSQSLSLSFMHSWYDGMIPLNVKKSNCNISKFTNVGPTLVERCTPTFCQRCHNVGNWHSQKWFFS